MALAAILFDLGDVIMREDSEEKTDGVTQRAELVPAMADLLHSVQRAGTRLGLVADTRAGTFRNVLRQHGLYELFETFAISDLLGVEKPDPRIFLHALEALGIPPEEWEQVVMVGNNLARDIRGANRLGLISIWLAWNARYPVAPASGEEVPRYQVTDAGELSTLLTLLDQGGTPPAFAYPRPDAAMPRG
jgi:putative hydrolase of the HAD superfamily